jgi:hypothetical protein
MAALTGRTYDRTVLGLAFAVESPCPRGRSTYGFEAKEDHHVAEETQT